MQNSVSMLWNNVKCIVLLMVLFCLGGVSYADIYKYQDANGRWTFSDKVKKGVGSVEVVLYQSQSGRNAYLRDFDTILNKKYPSNDPVKKASLAVVTIKSAFGIGSGFFISEDCYLVTNKHVIRPTKGGQRENTLENIKKTEEKILLFKQKLSENKKRLEIYKENLTQNKKYLDGLASGNRKNIVLRQYELDMAKYLRDAERVKSAQKNFKEQETKFIKQKSDFNFSDSIASAAQTFNVILKDNTAVRANLVKISSSDDLALLKISRCKAPYLLLSNPDDVSQGMDIYAIGSPLGLRDQLTQGTVTQLSDKGITTDAQILPGNSGGPLISESGEVVGVNTIKVAKGSALATGFGIAIPSTKVTKNFEKYLQ